MTDLARRLDPRSAPRPAAKPAAPRRGIHAAGRAAIPLWLVAAHVDWCPVDDRARFVESVRPELPEGAALLVTCHRAELFGPGGAADAEAIVEGLAPELRTRVRTLTGDAVVRHAFRLAAGLESAVVGEDQVLHQVRRLRDEFRGREVDSHLPRLFEMAIGVGRRARAARSEWQPSDAGLASRAIDWLCLRGDVRRGDELLVVGAGTMGGLLAREAHRRGLDVTVASRSPERARALAASVAGRPVDLSDAARLVPAMAAAAIALGGEWTHLAPDAILPPTVDLSSPPAVPGLPARRFRGGGAAALDIDGLYTWDGTPRLSAANDAYVAVAASLVDEATERYARWSAGRGSLETMRAIRERAERQRIAELERLMRRAPGLAGRDRALVEAFSEQLVAALLHAPTAHLRDDADGSAAEAARRLFDLTIDTEADA